MNLLFILDVILISLATSLVWLWYLKFIDVFEHEKWQNIVITFVLGSIIPYIIFPIHDYIYNPLNISNSDNPILSFLFFTLGVGLLEEVVKLIPVLIVLRFLKPAINEPLDYVKYICVSALGFAFGENVDYALRYGGEILVSRSVLTVPVHMFLSGLFIYGYVLYKYHQAPVKTVFVYGAIGFAAHGIFDFVLDVEGQVIGFLLSLVFFMLLISAFSTILNNCLNNSPFFSPKKSVDQDILRSRMGAYYTLIIILIMIYTLSDVEDFFIALISFLCYKLSILYLVVVRLSRFSIVPGFWKPVRPEFPFTFNVQGGEDDLHILFGLLAVKGEGYNDTHISVLFGDVISVVPLGRNSYLGKVKKGIIEKKIHAEDQTIYIAKIFLDSSLSSYKTYALVAKKKGATHTEENFPIASLNRSENNRLVFIEWVILKK